MREALEDHLRQLAAAAFDGAVDLQFERMDAGGYEVLFNRVAFLLLATPGVVDYTSLRLNGGSANLAVPADALPVLTEVTVT